jgi:hypothetical protein
MTEEIEARNEKSSWIIARGPDRLELRGDVVRVDFEIANDGSLLVHLRAADSAAKTGVASASFNMGCLLDLLHAYCVRFEFSPFSSEEVALHSKMWARETYVPRHDGPSIETAFGPEGDHIRHSIDSSRVRSSVNREKRNRELNALKALLEQTEDLAGVLHELVDEFQ